MAKRGRPHRPYRTAAGTYIDGLARRPDGRWFIVKTGEWFTEADETKAIQRFRATCPAESVFVSVGEPSFWEADHAEVADQLTAETELSVLENPEDDTTEIGYDLDAKALWRYFAKTLVGNPLYVARMTGIESLANYATMQTPKPSMRLTKLLAVYLDHAECGITSKQKCAANFRDFIQKTEAKTLDDLTREVIMRFRTELKGRYSPETINYYYGCIRTVLNTAARHGKDVDEKQIEAAKVRLKLLYSVANPNANDPHPISREDFHQLLENVGKTDVPELWRAMLLMGLNAALYMEDLCSLRWVDEEGTTVINLKKGTFISNRKKKGKCIRVAMLWPETIEALKALPKRGNSPFVFTSRTGTRYNRCTKLNDFKDFRIKAGVNNDVKFSHLRDGAYTAACHAAGVDGKFARLLAGHKAPGLEDKYVKRNPKIVQPAIDAVYREYFAE